MKTEFDIQVSHMQRAVDRSRERAETATKTRDEMKRELDEFMDGRGRSEAKK
jgi:hypothetical protein